MRFAVWCHWRLSMAWEGPLSASVVKVGASSCEMSVSMSREEVSCFMSMSSSGSLSITLMVEK